MARRGKRSNLEWVVGRQALSMCSCHGHGGQSSLAKERFVKFQPAAESNLEINLGIAFGDMASHQGGSGGRASIRDKKHVLWEAAHARGDDGHGRIHAPISAAHV